MAGGAVARMLEDGHRLHLQHGPIDLIIEANGPGKNKAYERAELRFQSILDELVEELILLRSPCELNQSFMHPVAQRMQKAAMHFLPKFITPMAAVAGAVADEILDVMKSSDVEKIYVNNGGDIAFHLTGNHSVNAAIAAPFPARLQICATDPWRGVATSGWRGRSHSLGIADSVTVIGANAAVADTAATMIANTINLENHPNITRQPAHELSPDSDLQHRLVTIDVGELSTGEINKALDYGQELACSLIDKGLIGAAMLILKDQTRQTGSSKLIDLQNGAKQYA